MKRSLMLAVTAAAVAASFGFATPQAIVANDAVTIEALQNQLLDLKDAANNIQARADAEKRDLSEDEKGEIAGIFADFEKTEADIQRRQDLAAMNDKMTAGPARTAPEANDPPQNQPARQPQARTRPTVPAEPRSADAGRWGFRSQAEFYSAIVNASRQGSVTDPRLIVNAPSSYGQEGVGVDGGFAVPPDFRTAIVQRVMGEDSLLSRTDQMTTSSNQITVPTDETTQSQTTGGIQAYWESEAGQIANSKPLLGEKSVKANKVTALVPLTAELLEDAPSMASYVGRKAPEKIGYKVNEAIIRGTGVGQPLGFLNSGALVTVAAESSQVADTVTFKNIVAMYTRMPANAKRNAVWLINEDVEQQLMQMQFPGTGTAVPVYLPPGGLSASPYASLLGRPIISSEACSALGDVGDISFVDFSQYMSVTKTGGIKQDVSLHVYFDFDMVAFRFILRVGGNPWWNTPITRANGLNRSPFVTLAAR